MMMVVSWRCWAGFLLAIFVSAVSGAEVLELIPYTANWRYEASGTDLATTWRANDYDDSAWQNGPGALGFPADENLLGLTTLGTQFAGDRSIHAYYFRHTFDLPVNSQGLVLFATNLLDDGAVFYLNGQEIARIAMPSETITHNTLATRSLDISSTGADVFQLELAPLMQGTNVLAVELHQGGSISSDVIFAMNLWAELPGEGPVEILRHPLSQTLATGNPVTFSVRAIGSPPYTFQWRKNGQPILGATNQTYSIPAIEFSDFGQYQVRVSNPLGEDLSEPARLTVVRPPILLVPFSQEWRYEVSGTDLGTAWRQPDYDESAWSAGPGPLGYEDDVLREPLRTTFPSNGGVTYYFRTEFQLTAEPPDLELVATNLVDDGVVLYLNGVEVERLGMQAGTINFDSPAGRVLGEAAFEVMTLPADALVPGRNVLAAEAHNVNSTSSDLVFGLSLLASFVPHTPLTISQEPGDITIAERESATLAATVAGVGARYQWFHNSQAIPGATKDVLFITEANGDDAGLYQLRASNEVGVVYSRMAQLSVILDSEPPHLISADWADTLEAVDVLFSEEVSPHTATNLAHYEIRATSSEILPIQSLEWINGYEVLLRTSPRAPQLNYVLTVSGVTDLALGANSEVTARPITFLVPVITWTNIWQFYDPMPNVDPAFPGPDWNEIAFDDFTWGTGAAVFAVGASAQSLPIQVGTPLTTGKVTSYFRHRWEAPFSRFGAELRLRHLIDDGAIFYLNGQELYRFNLPISGVQPTTPALISIGVATILDTTTHSPILLQADENLLAAELHRRSATDADAAFGAELIVHALSWASGPIVITSQPRDQLVTENRSAQFEVVAAGGKTLQWRANGTPIAGADTSQLRLDSISPAWNDVELTVVIHNDTHAVTSEVAHVAVTLDLVPPILVAAWGEGTTILLEFDEPIEPTSVGSGLYRLINTEGPARAILSAVLTSPTQILLTLDGLARVGDQIRVSQVRDTAVTGNESNSGRTVGFRSDLVRIDSVWRYNAAGIDLGVEWRQQAYNDDSWPSGPGLLGTESALLPELIRTPVPDSASGGPITVYFRTVFFNHLPPPQARLELTHLIDDGVVLYLNGQEIHRLGITGTPTFTTLASRTVGDATYEGPFPLSVTNLQLGANVLAGELHQASAGSTDDVFGLILASASIPSLALPPELLLRVRLQADQCILAWDDDAYRLQDAPSPSGPWEFVSDLNNPFSVTPAGQQRFYRLASAP